MLLLFIRRFFFLFYLDRLVFGKRHHRLEFFSRLDRLGLFLLHSSLSFLRLFFRRILTRRCEYLLDRLIELVVILLIIVFIIIVFMLLLLFLTVTIIVVVAAAALLLSFSRSSSRFFIPQIILNILRLGLDYVTERERLVV